MIIIILLLVISGYVAVFGNRSLVLGDAPIKPRQNSESGTQKDAFEINVVLPLGGVISYFIDVESFLILGYLYNMNGDQSKVKKIINNKYINHNGILFPDGYVYEFKGKRKNRKYQNVKFNFTPDMELFEIPAELK